LFLAVKILYFEIKFVCSLSIYIKCLRNSESECSKGDGFFYRVEMVPRKRPPSKKDSEVEEIDLRKHVGLLGRFRLEKKGNARHHIRKVRHFVEHRRHADFFDVLQQILKPKFLLYSKITYKNYGDLILFLWQYCLLGKTKNAFKFRN